MRSAFRQALIRGAPLALAVVLAACTTAPPVPPAVQMGELDNAADGTVIAIKRGMTPVVADLNRSLLERNGLELRLVNDDVKYVDAFREVNPEPDQYTWWSNRGQAWSKNVGWRIDYHVLSPGLRGSVRSAEILKAQRFSDHAPLTVTYDL